MTLPMTAGIHVHRVEIPAPVRPFLHERIVLFKRGGEFTAIDFGGLPNRHEGVFALLREVENGGPLPDFGPVLLSTEDRPRDSLGGDWTPLAFCSRPGYPDLAVPDFVFVGWPAAGIEDYEATRRELARIGAEPAATELLGWIGNCNNNPARWAMYELGMRHPDLLDIRHRRWEGLELQEPPFAVISEPMTLAEQVARWSVLIDVEGVGYSGRLKLLLHSGRPVLGQERVYREWWNDELRPWEHYIPVRADLGDLVERVEWTRANPAQSAEIGANGQRFALARLTRADAVAEWARRLRELAAEPRTRYGSPQVEQLLAPLLSQLGALA